MYIVFYKLGSFHTANITKWSKGSHEHNTGRRADCSHSMVSERCINTNNVSEYNCGYSSKDTWWPDTF